MPYLRGALKLLSPSKLWNRNIATFTLYAFEPTTGRYRQVPRSVPGARFSAIAGYAVRPDTPRALREFESEIRAKG